jgi:folate-dependent tRNA-U54 methylase TrmFO/GidA
MNSNFGLLEPLSDPPRDKSLRRQKLVELAEREFDAWLATIGVAEEAAA